MAELSGTEAPREAFGLAHAAQRSMWTMGGRYLGRSAALQRGMAGWHDRTNIANMHAQPGENKHMAGKSSEEMVSNQMGDLDGDSLI
eukprot:gene6697-8888_t